MKFKDKYNISSEFDDIFAFNSEEEELEHDAQMLMFNVEKAIKALRKLSVSEYYKVISSVDNAFSERQDEKAKKKLKKKVRKIINLNKFWFNCVANPEIVTIITARKFYDKPLTYEYFTCTLFGIEHSVNIKSIEDLLVIKKYYAGKITQKYKFL